MKALCWHGANDVRIDHVKEPQIINPRDAIVRVTSTAICGSDLHLYDGYIPSMEEGDILGHEFMGEVVEVGPGVKNLNPGDRVVVPFTICCGACYFCEAGLWSLCDNSNPNARLVEKIYGHSGAGLFGYSHLYGGYAGGQTEFVRVPFADVAPIRIPDGIEDDKVLFLSDILPTAYMAAENCSIRPGDTVAIWGAGPVGLLAIQCALSLGAERVISIDNVPERLKLAEFAGAETLNYDSTNIQDELRIRTGGRGPDSCIDAVGMEAHGHDVMSYYDRVKQAVRLETDRPTALRQAIFACRKGGTVSIPGVYGGVLDKIPFGAAFGKGLTMKMGQTHVPRYTRMLLNKILDGTLDPSFIITHRMPLDAAPLAYEIFGNKQNGCVKVVLTPLLPGTYAGAGAEAGAGGYGGAGAHSHSTGTH